MRLNKNNTASILALFYYVFTKIECYVFEGCHEASDKRFRCREASIWVNKEWFDKF